MDVLITLAVLVGVAVLAFWLLKKVLAIILVAVLFGVVFVVFMALGKLWK